MYHAFSHIFFFGPYLVATNQKAAEEARQKKIAEEEALLSGRLYEFLELEDESNLITVEDAKEVGSWYTFHSIFREPHRAHPSVCFLLSTVSSCVAGKLSNVELAIGLQHVQVHTSLFFFYAVHSRIRLYRSISALFLLGFQ